MPDPTPAPDPSLPGNPAPGNAPEINPVVPPATPPPVPYDWTKDIPKEFAEEKLWEPLKGKPVPEILKAYANAEKMIGGSVRIPKEDAKPEEWAAFYKKMGRPDTVEGYNIQKPDKLPDGVTWNDDLTSWFAKTAHENGLSKNQVQKIMKSWNEVETAKAHSAQKEMGQRLSKLQEQWGDEFAGRVELGVRGIERLMPKEEVTEFKALLDTTGIGNHPLMIKYAHLVGKMLQEDGYIIGDGKGGALGAEAAKKEIAAINADQAGPYWNDGPGHKEAVERMNKLHRIASGG